MKKWTKKKKDAFVEGIKQVVRVAIIGIVPVVIAQLQANTWDWRTIWVAGAIALLMGVDKWAHKNEIETPLDLKGLDALK